VAVGFVGHLQDPVLLSSAVLANSLYNVTGLSLMSGLSAGMETLCGQVSDWLHAGHNASFSAIVGMHPAA